jgi:hypothetical protein
MKTRAIRFLILAGLASTALAATAPASAHDGYWHGPARGFVHYGYARPYYYVPRVVVVRPPVFVPRPVVVYSPAPVYYAPPAYYSAPVYPAPVFGAIGGAIAGAAIGSVVGDGRPGAIAAGSVLGAVIGSQAANPY